MPGMSVFTASWCLFRILTVYYSLNLTGRVISVRVVILFVGSNYTIQDPMQGFLKIVNFLLKALVRYHKTLRDWKQSIFIESLA